ncbi:MAG: DUF2760 domain-containing protein [Methylococcales bacterium]|nr:DUF2760 domain-containing protein [Methylococcales bacterium]
MNSYAIDLSLRPTTFDLWHVYLAGMVAVLALTLILVLITALLAMRRSGKSEKSAPATSLPPEIRIVEKIIEVEKPVPGPAPEPIILREATADAALQVLSLLQKEARFIDFIEEDMGGYSDAEIGAAARIVHQGCSKAIKAHFSLSPVSSAQEGSRITLQPGFDAYAFRLTGNITGAAPFTGTLVHKGWQVDVMNLPRLTEGHDPHILAAAEVEL